MSVFPYLVAVWLLGIGLYGIVTTRNLIHAVMSLTVVQSGTYVLLLAIGYRHGARAPIFADIPPGSPAVDPVLQALVLVDLVVEATGTALLLALAVQAHKRFGSLDPSDLRPLRS
jgi:multicomponent Na+:H+ antiporter subunit C